VLICHEDICASGGIAPPFLISALDGGEWSASRPCRFTSEETAPSTHRIASWVGPKVGPGAVEKRKISHSWESNPDRPVRSLSLYRHSYYESCGKRCTVRHFLASVALYIFMCAVDDEVYIMQYHSTRPTLDETADLQRSQFSV
jgi:hypothetical protein